MPNEAEMYRKYMTYLSAHERWVSACDNYTHTAPGPAKAMQHAWDAYLAAGGNASDAIPDGGV